MAAQGKALTYLLTVLGGIAGALLGFIVTGLFAYGLLGLAGMEDREGGRAMIAFISIAPFGALAGLLAGIYLVLRYRGGYRGFAGVVGRGALIVAEIFAVGALVLWIYGLTDDVLVRNGPPPEAKFEIRLPPNAMLPEKLAGVAVNLETRQEHHAGFPHRDENRGREAGDRGRGRPLFSHGKPHHRAQHPRRTRPAFRANLTEQSTGFRRVRALASRRLCR